MSPKHLIVAPIVAMVLSGCAVIFDGTSQNIAVNTSPADAKCTFTRGGQTIAFIPSTPSTATVEKTKDDIKITCTKDGYDPGTYINHSGVAGAAVADVLGGILTGGVAWAIDSSSGADNKYDSQVNLSLALTRPKTTEETAQTPSAQAPSTQEPSAQTPKP